MTGTQFLFLGLALIAVITSIGVVAFQSPVRSALSLVANFFVLAFLYFGLQAELLGITQIMVYAGAIMVLFLFVIMLLNLGSADAIRSANDRKPLLAITLGTALALMLFGQVITPLGGYNLPQAADDFGTPAAIGKTLFAAYVWPFEVTSILLLVGIVGAILLAKRRL